MNYKQTAVAGTSWIRCSAIHISNPLEDSENANISTLGPSAVFTEQKVIAMEGTDITIPAGTCSKTFNPMETITIVNPETGQPTGNTITHAELYVILYSLYLQTAQERDMLVASIVANTAAVEAAVT